MDADAVAAMLCADAKRTPQFEAALDAVGNGWHVFPCSPDKTPLTDHGFKDASTDLTVVCRFWSEYPHALVGIATGASGLVVVDIDCKNGAPGWDEWHRLVEEIGVRLEDTTLVETPSGGMHVYYRANGIHATSTASTFAPGIDTRAEGGYVIGAGSPGYLYVDEHGPEKLAALPQALAELLASKPTPTLASPPADLIPEGQRDATLASLAGTMRRRGMSPDEILAALRVANQKRCRPPMDDPQVVKIANSVGRYEPQAAPRLEVPPPSDHTEELTSEQALAAFSADLERRRNGEIVGLPWPPEWPALGSRIGPIEPGSLTVIAARPSIGKTMQGMQLARFLAGRGKRVLFVSRELSTVRLIRRHICSYGADMYRLRTGRLSRPDEEALATYRRESAEWALFYDDVSRTAEQMLAAIARTSPDLVIIDYLQRLAYDTEKEYAAITRIVNELQDMTLGTGVPIVCLSQLRRPEPGMEWKAPKVGDTRGSGAVEERAANMVLLHRNYTTSEEDRFGKKVKVSNVQSDDGFFLVGKCSDGETGSPIAVHFNGARMTITERL